MAITTSKVTYSLKPETVDRVQELSLAWGVPKSEVIRRAIDKAVAEKSKPEKKETPLEIFLRLQKSGSVTPEAETKFNADVRRWRRASGRKRA
jgi:predicted transcriptional regulator